MPALSKSPTQTKLLDEVQQVLRPHHYSIHTDRAYVDWVVQFAHFHHMRSRQDLFPPEPKIEGSWKQSGSGSKTLTSA